MIRLTLMYNLADHVNEDEFLEWRLGEHQEDNMSSPGVVRSDFSRVDALAIDPTMSGQSAVVTKRCGLARHGELPRSLLRTRNAKNDCRFHAHAKRPTLLG